MANTLITQLNNPAELLKINKRIATMMSILLIIACTYALAEITWMLIPQDEDKALPIRKDNLITDKQAQQNSFRQLTSANIFGVGQHSAVTRQAKAPVTKLNLTLKGVLAAVPMKLASAIIAQGKSGKEDIYSVGDKISGGVLVKEIHPEHVVLERSGRQEILKLQKISGVSFNSTNKTRYNSPARRSGGGAAETLTNIRTDILKNPTSFADYALPVIVKENGKQIGYRLKPQGKGGLLSELGLQETDVITQINGVKLDKPQNGISALRKLSTAKSVNMVVKRNGAEVPLNITLQ
jgi:general secretion pathway protein C